MIQIAPPPLPHPLRSRRVKIMSDPSSDSRVSGPTSEGVSSEATAGSSRISVWDDISLHVTKWVPSGEIRAIMYLAHGVGEHMGRYEKLGQELAENGILTFGHDHVGHGRSGGDRVHINDFATYVQDVISHVREMKESFPGTPCFLMGHSMGGLIAVLVAIEKQELFTGAIFSAASVEVDPNLSSLLVFFSRVVSFLFPQLGVKGLDTRLISTIPEEVKMYEDDPLVYHHKLKAKWGSEFLRAVDVSQQGIKAISIPSLIFHGTEDQIVGITASELINSETASTDKTYERFEGNFHEVLHDKGQEKARDLIRDWVLARIGSV